MATSVLVKRGAWRFQEFCSREEIPLAVRKLKALYPSAFRDGVGLSAEFVTTDANGQIVGDREKIDLAPFLPPPPPPPPA